MCIRDRPLGWALDLVDHGDPERLHPPVQTVDVEHSRGEVCLLYTSDAADERSSVDLGGRRIIKKNKHTNTLSAQGNIYLTRLTGKHNQIHIQSAR